MKQRHIVQCKKHQQQMAAKMADFSLECSQVEMGINL